MNALERTPPRRRVQIERSKQFQALSPSTRQIRKGNDGRWHVSQNSPQQQKYDNVTRNILYQARSPPKKPQYSRSMAFTPSNITIASPKRNTAVVPHDRISPLPQPNSTTTIIGSKHIYSNRPQSSLDQAYTTNTTCSPIQPNDDNKKQSRKRTKAQKTFAGLQAMWKYSEQDFAVAVRSFISSLRSGFGMHQDRYRQFLQTLRDLHERNELNCVEKAYPALMQALTGSTKPDKNLPMIKFVKLMGLFLSDADALRFGCYHERRSLLQAWRCLLQTKKYLTAARSNTASKQVVRSIGKLSKETCEMTVYKQLMDLVGNENALVSTLDTLFQQQKCSDIINNPTELDTFETITSDTLLGNSASTSANSKSQKLFSTIKSINNENDCTEPKYDPLDYESIHVPYNTRTYTSRKNQLCDCDCHVKADVSIGDHCTGCRLKFINGRLLMLNNNKWVPAAIDYIGERHVVDVPVDRNSANNTDYLIWQEKPVLEADHFENQPSTEEPLGLIDSQQLNGENTLMNRLFGLMDNMDANNQLNSSDTVSILGAAMRELEDTRSCMDTHGVDQPWTEQEDTNLLDVVEEHSIRSVMDISAHVIQSAQKYMPYRSSELITDRLSLLLEKLRQFEEITEFE